MGWMGWLGDPTCFTVVPEEALRAHAQVGPGPTVLTAASMLAGAAVTRGCLCGQGSRKALLKTHVSPPPLLPMGLGMTILP